MSDQERLAFARLDIRSRDATIARLRADLAQREAEVARLQAENERLRHGLQRIASVSPYVGVNPSYELGFNDCQQHMQNAARSTLSPEDRAVARELENTPMTIPTNPALRCEPADTTKDGAHWLSHDIGGDIHLRPFWWDSRRKHWVEVGKSYSHEEMARQGWVYECRVPSPAEIDALVRAAEMMVADPIGAAATDWQQIRDALAPFAAKETKDA